MGDQCQREEGHPLWVGPFPSILPWSPVCCWRARLTNWGQLLFLDYSGIRAKHLPTWEPLDPISVLQLWWHLWLWRLLGQRIQFPGNVCFISLCPVCQITPLRHLGSWFPTTPACPASNCMIGHKQKEILCWRERMACSIWFLLSAD